MHADPSGTPSGIPPLIKRNTALIALSLSFTGAGMGLAFGLGPLMVVQLTDSASLAGLSVGLIGLSRFLVAYPIGKITDTYGRKPGVLLGLALGLAGALVLGASMQAASTWLFITGMLIFGMGMNAAHQLRVAATDMFPARLRARALGYVAMGSLLGLVICPLLIAGSEAFASRIGQDPLGLPWFLMPILIVPGMLIVRAIRPDPKTIGMQLDRYYADASPAPRTGAHATKFHAGALLRNPDTRMAIVSNAAAHGNMSIVMVLTSLVLAHHGHSLSAIAVSHMFHTAGMFAFTIPLGRLADRIGRTRVMYPGVATTLVGAALVSFTADFWLVTLGTFLVGLGWAAANVAATALLADQARTEERGRAIGVTDSVAGGIAVFVAFATGPLIEASGLPAAGMLAVLLAAIPFIMLPAAKSHRRVAPRG